MDNYFMTPEEYEELLAKLNPTTQVNDNNMSDHFKPATDFEVPIENKKEEIKIDSKNLSKENVEKFLASIVSGKQYPFNSEAGIVVSGGDLFVKLEKLIDMVNSGNFNIVSAKYITSELIQVKYQEFVNGFDDSQKKNVL